MRKPDWVPSCIVYTNSSEPSTFGVAIGQPAQDIFALRNGPLCSRRVVEAEGQICDPQDVTGSGIRVRRVPSPGLLCDTASIAHVLGRG